MDFEIEQPTVWDHVYFWTKEIFILAGLVTFITVSLSAFFFLPEGNMSSDFLALILY